MTRSRGHSATTGMAALLLFGIFGGWLMPVAQAANQWILPSWVTASAWLGQLLMDVVLS